MRGISWLSRTRPLIATSTIANMAKGARFASAASKITIRIAARWRLADRASGTRGIWAPAAPASRADRAAAASKITIRIASRWRRAVLGCGGPCGTREIAAPGAAASRATSMSAVIFASLP